jgi:hypothetical protein
MHKQIDFAILKWQLTALHEIKGHLQAQNRLLPHDGALMAFQALGYRKISSPLLKCLCHFFTTVSWEIFPPYTD